MITCLQHIFAERQVRPMHIVAISLNYRTAPVEVREQFSFVEEQLPEALQTLKHTKSIVECVIVSTCNRTEIYAVVDRLHMCGHYIRDFMERWFGISRAVFTKYLQIHEDREAMNHLFRVTAGLDSMVIGETQILGQIRGAFLLAQREETTGTIFNKLFKQAITLAKRAHTETAIGESAVSVSYAAVELGKRIFGNYRNKNVMIIGAGKMGELTVKHLQSGGVSKVVVANRTIGRAHELIDRLGGIACTLDEVVPMIIKHEIDIVITSTGSQGYVLTREQVEHAIGKRGNKPLFMIDIAVPRDLDPAISKLSHVFLYDIDDLQAIVDSNMEARRKESDKIQRMIEIEIVDFLEWYRTLGVAPVIRALQQRASAIHEVTMDSLLKKLPELDEREIKVIRKLSKSIVNQMLHDPILRIKELSAQRRGDDAVELFTHLFALEEELERSGMNEEDTLLEDSRGKGKVAESMEKSERTPSLVLRSVSAHM
jgi:glutamyl-tRNA reductase